MAEDADERRMYVQLSRQELSHAAMFEAHAEKCVSNGQDESAKKVWHHLKGHIDDWASDISSCLDKMERM